MIIVDYYQVCMSKKTQGYEFSCAANVCKQNSLCLIVREQAIKTEKKKSEISYRGGTVLPAVLLSREGDLE